ncbi:uncharacterized protein LOC125556690 [Nematostella vectensis]|uniref:uncharacterized protein LOC125556690 n=1 Tax=Nematostella vectensis TaxID=45351 RepID=UPI002077958E|nr:uncharacterized protein LOC125556690 [Nematostella vectensis]
MGNSVTWYQLKMPCPIKGCPNSERCLDWVCSADGYTMYVCEKGRLSCGGSHDAEIVNWKFDCGDRDGPHKNVHLLYADLEGFAHAMAIGVAHLNRAGADWVKQLVDEVERQYKR